MRYRAPATLLLLAIGVSGCATITRGTTEAFSIETEPSGASVTTSLGTMCEPTPCVIPKVSREAEFTVTISKPGYVTTTHNVSHTTAGGGAAGMAGNVLLGGIIGAAVDANSGATQQLVPNPLHVVLEPEAAVAAAPTAEPAAEAMPIAAEGGEAATP
jgi:hypothetical protein